MSDVHVVLCTVPNMDAAETLARSLVDQRLCACVNVVPGVRSFYRWEDKVCDDQELILVMKTTVEQTRALTQAIETEHPYDVPEVVALPVTGGSTSYLDWVAQQVR